MLELLYDQLWVLGAGRALPTGAITIDLQGSIVKKPGIPITVIGLCTVAVLGLITQYLAAEHAFSLIGRTAMYSYAAALLIESAIVVDAVVFSKTRNLIAGISLLVALGVSGIYNYTLADMSSADIVLGQKLALAIGPLIALATIALALGEELYKYDQVVQEWKIAEQDLQDVHDREQSRLVQEQTRTVTAQRATEHAAAQDREQWDREQEQHKLDAQLHENALARRRAERWARKAEITVQVDAPTLLSTSNNGSALDELIKLSPGALENRRAFRNALTAHGHLVETITPKALAERTGQTERTARRWVSDARETR